MSFSPLYIIWLFELVNYLAILKPVHGTYTGLKIHSYVIRPLAAKLIVTQF